MEKITVKVDGREVDLEDAFEIFEDVFENVDDAFEHMEKAFGSLDVNIREKVGSLKRKVAAKKSDKYDYIPDNDEDKEEYEYYKKQTIKRGKYEKHLRTIVTSVMLGLFLTVAIIAFWIMIDDKPEFGVPLPAPVSEKLEKL